MSGTNLGSEDVEVTANVYGGTVKHDAIPVSKTDVVGKLNTDDGVAGSEEKEKLEPERTADLTRGLNGKTDIDSGKKARKFVIVNIKDDLGSDEDYFWLEQLQQKSVIINESSGSESYGKHQDGQKDETSDKTEKKIIEKLERMHISDDQEKITEKGNITADLEETVLPANVDVDYCADITDAFYTPHIQLLPLSWQVAFRGEKPTPVITKEDYSSDTYRMDYPNRGKALIINNKTFRIKRLPERTGTDIDAQELDACFTKMGFVTETFPNLTKQKMLDCLQTASEDERYTWKSDCFVCAILSHGAKDGIYGVDGKLTDIYDLLEPFNGENCLGLAGKPKLFFIQACQGKKLDEGAHMDVTETYPVPMVGDTIKIPVNADFLIARSSVPGYTAWRHKKNGSWFIQALCDVLRKDWKEMDLLSMMARVNIIVAAKFEKENVQEYKQIPCIASMLTKIVLFTEK